MQPNLTEEMEYNHYHAHFRGLAPKTFKNIQRSPNSTMEDILEVFRRNYVKPESSASARLRFNTLFFHPESQKIPDYLEKLQKKAEKAFGDNAHHFIEYLLYANNPTTNLQRTSRTEKPNRQDDNRSRKSFLQNVGWSDTTLSPEKQQQFEGILIEIHNIYDRHLLDIGTNREFKVKLTPNDDRVAYSKSLQTPINLKDDITVEIALLHKYGIVTTLPHSKDASPIFAQRKPN